MNKMKSITIWFIAGWLLVFLIVTATQLGLPKSEFTTFIRGTGILMMTPQILNLVVSFC